MKKIFTIITLIVLTINMSGQEKAGLYNPKANAKEDISNAIKLANEENKHVLIQIGGNWCPWCVKLHRFIESHASIDSALQANYVVTRVHFSKKDNINKEIFQELGFPQRFGFPVIVILNQKGERIHTQNTVYLEEGKNYNAEKLLKFFEQWDVDALDPENYSK